MSEGTPQKTSDGNTSFLRAARAGNLDKVLEHLKNNVDINTSNANGLNALHLAAKDGHVHVVAELLRRCALVDNATKKGNTALHIASLAGQEEVVKLLLQHHASVNVQSQNGFTPLYMAAQENHDSVVKLLLANGANQSLATEDGFTPLLVAMQQGHDKVVAVLLENDTRGKVRLPALHIAAKKDDVRAATLLLENDHNPDVTSKSGFTPLHIASHYGNEAIANLLIQKGADVNFPAKHNITPLHVTAKWGKTNMVSLLLEKGANIESKTRDGLTPLHCAARSGHEQVVDMLLERGAPISSKTKNGLAPLHMAAQGEHVDAARILLYHRAPVDEVTVDYLTALHVAAHCGHVRVAKLLLDRNADPNARALNGFTPLHIACKKNRIKVVELLLKHGASISATTESGLTPLHVASFMGCMNIVIYLLQHDASPDVPTVRGETPLHLAARANQTDIIRILLRNGAQVDARAREQQTPLHIASRLGNVDIVMLLLQHGAQVDATTKDMYTALHIAAKEGQDEVAAVLIENGASLEAATKKGFQPLHLTAKYGHIKVAELLLQKGAPVDAQGKNGVTPLHVASHYDHQNVALLLLNKGASPHRTAKNGHTPLHIAARKNQMDIAATLLEYGAQTDCESRAGFTPLHLAAQEGHVEMCNLLLEHKADANHQAKNGLSPLHLCAQEDRVEVAKLLVKHGAHIDTKTKLNYTPLHVASHFGHANIVRFLIENGANTNADTTIGYTPLHQAAQQGHLHIVTLLVENKADPNALTSNGQTPLNISQKLGYISVVESLKNVTNQKTSPMQTSVNENEKYRVVAPEAMHETFMSDSEEEGGDDAATDHPYRYLTVDEMKSLGDDSLPIDVTRDERIDSNRMVTSAESANLHHSEIEDQISPQHITDNQTTIDKNYAIDNVKIERHPEQIGKLHWKNFLVSFMVDARGGAMRGCRHSGIRIVVPARSAAQPTRITCRYVKPQRTLHPPQLMEGEALASRVLELGPVSAKFIGPVVMEVPHFASLRGKEREIVILRSDNGETWREHQVENSDEIVHDILNECFEPEDIKEMDDLAGGRLCRFVTYDFPQYFAIVSRIRQEVHAIGPEGGMVSSTVVPQVQAVFPQGALTKKIKVGLQAQPIDPDLTAKLLGRGVAVSPIVTVEPRRRKFHKAITLSMPAPKAHSQGMINQYSGNAPTLRLLCSITGGPSRAQWEDVTGSTPLTFVNDCVSFTTTVSARFWLMDCRNISDATKMATELYREAIHVPFMAKFVVFAKRIDPLEARLRVFCMTDDKEDKTLEYQEHFTEVAKSRDVEVLEGKPQYTEFAGNLVPVTKSGEQLHIPFKAFRENRLPFNVRVKDPHADTVGRALFMREPRVAKGEQPQQPICILNIVLPDRIIPDHISIMDDNRDVITRIDISQFHRSPQSDNLNYLGDLRIVDISNLLGEDWVQLAPEIGINENEIQQIIAENPNSTARQAQSMLRIFIKRKDNGRPILEKGLRSIKRDDIIDKCMKITNYIQSSKQSGPVAAVRKHTSLDNGYEEPDIMKDSESVEELVIQDDHHRLQQFREREELKYSAEEKIVEDSGEDTEEDETIKRSVAERRDQIQKRLSIERQIPASTQKKEIDQEITEIKRHSLIDDKKALHEEEIIMHAPTDNVIKSSVIPEPVIKLKSSKNEEVDVSKNDFDKELQEKFKSSIKGLEEFEHKPTVEITTKGVKETVQQETSEHKTDTKIRYDSTVTEKSIKAFDDKLLEELKTEKTEFFDQLAKDAGTHKTTVTKVDKSKPHEEIKTVDTTEKGKVDEQQKTSLDNKLTTERTIDKPNEIGDTKQFLEQEIISTIIRDDRGLHTDTLAKQITLTSTKDFLEGEILAQNEPVVTDLILNRAYESETTGQAATDVNVSHERYEHELGEQAKTSKQKTEPSVDIRVSRDVFNQDIDSDEFYKTIEEKITKKMSQDLSILGDDLIATVHEEITISQTPPPTPNEIHQQQNEQIREHLQYKEATKQTKDHGEASGDSESTKETGSHFTPPKPTPRSLKITHNDESTAIVIPQARTTTTTKSRIDDASENDENRTIDRTSGDFTETKKFWQSLETSSQSSVDEAANQQQQQQQQLQFGITPPVPKPRSQVSSGSLVKTEESLDTSSPRDTSQTSSSKISSEQQVEYSERSSSDIKPELARDDDSITADDRLEDESFPNSEKFDSDVYDGKNRDEEFRIESLELDTERSDSSMYKIKEREDILDRDDQEEAADEEEEKASSASFYIGEKSNKIITKSAIEKKTEYAFDNAGYDSTHELVYEDEAADIESVEGKHQSKLEKDELEYSEKEIEKLNMQAEQLKSQEGIGLKRAAVVHSPVQPTKSSIDFEEPPESLKDSYKPERANEVRTPIEDTSKLAESAETISVSEQDKDLKMTTQKAAVVHSPIDSVKLVGESEYATSVNTAAAKQVTSDFILHETERSSVDKIYEVDFEHPKHGTDLSSILLAQKDLPVEATIEGIHVKQVTNEFIHHEKPPVLHSPVDGNAREIHKQVTSEFIRHEAEKSLVYGAPEAKIEHTETDFNLIQSTQKLLVSHSPVEDKTSEIHAKQVTNEFILHESERSAIDGTDKLEHSKDFELGFSSHKPPVLRSPIEGTTGESHTKQVTSEFIRHEPERSLVYKAVDVEIGHLKDESDFGLISSTQKAPVSHPSTDERTGEIHAKQVTSEFILHEAESSSIDLTNKKEYSKDFDLGFSSHKAPVLHSPLEVEKNLDEDKSIIDDSIDDTISGVRFSQFSEIAPTHSLSSETQKSSEVIFSPKQETSGSSNEDSLNKLGVNHRKATAKVPPSTRWSATDPESSGSHYESFEKSDSRPLSSDVENLYTTYANSSEYQTAHDASLIPGSTEYHTAASTLDHSGKTISSQESMKSLDSESSGNLGSIEVSEASETLVPSIADNDLLTDTQNQDFGLDLDECEQRLASLEACSGVLLEDFPLDESLDQNMTNMKRSHEMIFQYGASQQDAASPDSLQKTESSERKVSSEEEHKSSGIYSNEDTKFSTSLEDGSVLSMSLSSQSNVDTIVENVHDDMASSFGSSLIGSYEMQSILKDDMTGTSFEDKDVSERIESLIMTSSFVKSDDDVSSVNTQITTIKGESDEPFKRIKGHKRNDSTSFLKNMDIKKAPMSSDSSLDDEMVIHDAGEDTKKDSESDSEYDRYETEYSRAFKQPAVQGKKKALIEKTMDKSEVEIERKKSVPSIETIVEDVVAEVEIELELERSVSQNMLDYSKIPDITITDDPTKYVSDDEDDFVAETQKQQQKEEEKTMEPVLEEEPAKEQEIPVSHELESKSKQPKQSKIPVKYAKESEIKISDEQYQELVEKQYQTKMSETTTKFDSNDDNKADSPTSDSFELVEQPDISDEFVIIEEVAKEADELMTEGKSLQIASTKYVKKHDDEVEKIIVKSAPAATNEGSMILQGRHGVAFEFEESPPSATGTGSSGEDGNDIDSSRKWVEMQLAEQAQNLRYPYEMERGILEDIKEEDTDLEIGSSRISSFKDSFSSSDFDVLAGKKYFAKEHDNISMSSLQEFESLEHAISLENRKFHQGSQESLSNGSFPRKFTGRTAQADEISLASLNEFEGLENACLEAHLLEIKAKEEHALLLSRSDDSNKSSNSDKNGNGKTSTTKITETKMTVVTATAPIKVTEGHTITEFPTQAVQRTETVEIRSKSKTDDGDEDVSSNIMEVSTDSLDLGTKQKKEQSASKGTSRYGSSDSLEVSKSADVMTSSIDSIEISKDGATGKSSKSDADSIEQLGGKRCDTAGSKRDSIDSIEMQYALLTQSGRSERDSIDGNTHIEVSHSLTTSGNQTIESRVITATTSTASSSGYCGGISKDISSDSLNINQSEPELLLTSTESLDLNTSSTNATYQTQTNSQMSGSQTSCDSNTLVDAFDHGSDDRFGTITSSSSSSMVTTSSGGSGTSVTTTTTTTIYKTIAHKNDGDEILDYSELFDKDAKDSSK